MKVKAARSGRLESGQDEVPPVHFPLETSVGYQVRMVYRAMQRLLQTKVGPHGVTLGMWYYLRALWAEDGLTQRELSQRIGTMEPTTLGAIQTMERSGLVKRVRSKDDRRKVHIHLTKKGRDLERRLMPLAVEVVEASVAGFSPEEVQQLLKFLKSIRNNLEATQTDLAVSDEE
jgi:MarR family transcriptional regulator, organic hydroperoxide resistance regulator